MASVSLWSAFPSSKIDPGLPIKVFQLFIYCFCSLGNYLIRCDAVWRVYLGSCSKVGFLFACVCVCVFVLILMICFVCFLFVYLFFFLSVNCAV